MLPASAGSHSLSKTIRTARSRTSGEYLFVVLFMMLHPTHELEPPVKPAAVHIAFGGTAGLCPDQARTGAFHHPCPSCRYCWKVSTGVCRRRPGRLPRWDRIKPEKTWALARFCIPSRNAFRYKPRMLNALKSLPEDPAEPRAVSERLMAEVQSLPYQHETPLADHVGKLVRAGHALFVDDMSGKLQSRLNPKKIQTARLWSYVRDERSWCGDVPPCAWYQFSTDRKGEHLLNHLSGYTGTVYADGYAGGNGLFGKDKADEQACLVHVHRKFERTGSDIAKHAIRQIAELYAVEKEAKGKSPEERGALRQEKAKPIFNELEAWLQTQLPKISGKIKLAAAISYALNRMPKARAYLSDGRLELDKNICERLIRPITLGRKNYLFMGAVGGGKAAAIAYTLIEIAKMNNVDPEVWLTWGLSASRITRSTVSVSLCRGS
uniref:IS66 family transposase n=2 Tax=Aliiroseovarius crassostreae TaxID=154981 RepID=UPI003908B4C4